VFYWIKLFQLYKSFKNLRLFSVKITMYRCR